MLMQLNGDYFCESSRESGNGRFLVMARRKVRQDLAFILEVKCLICDGGTDFRCRESGSTDCREKGLYDSAATEIPENHDLWHRFLSENLCHLSGKDGWNLRADRNPAVSVLIR